MPRLRPILTTAIPFLTCLALLATPALAAPAPQPAATPPAHPLSAWTGGAVSGASAGPSYCAVEAPYDNHLTLGIAQAKTGALTLAVLIPGLHPPTTATWPVSLSIDGEAAATSSATFVGNAPSGAIVAIPLAAKGEATALATGRVLRISGAADVAAFRLIGTKEALAALRRCVGSLS